MSTTDPATAENPPSEIRAGDAKRDKAGAPDTEAEAGVGGSDTAEHPQSGSTGDGGKRKKGPSPEPASAAGVGGSD
jgi:hypothetical protein